MSELNIPSSKSWETVTLQFPFDAKVAVVNRVGQRSGAGFVWTDGPFWKRLTTGAIEATYTNEQLEFCMAAVGRMVSKEMK